MVSVLCGVKQDYHLDRNMLNCTKCMQPIGGVEPVLALNRRWHPGCFVCEECNCNLVDKPFTSKLNAPYCETCFAAKHRPVCEVGPVPQAKDRKVMGRISSSPAPPEILLVAKRALLEAAN